MQNDQAELHSKEPERQSRLDQYLWLGFPAIIIIWFVYGLYQGKLESDSSFDRLNALFSGLAFWGVIWAILLQKRELNFQRRELELTRQEVRGQTEQLEAQNLTMRQQRFENTFFSLLDLFNGIVNSIEITRSRTLGEPPFQIKNGRDCFPTLTKEFSTYYGDQHKSHPDWDHRALCIEAYETFSNSRQYLVGHYFRTLYNIFKFIDTSDINNKQIYFNILRAQLSSSELSLLFYNCISRHGSEKFKPLVEQYGLLEEITDPFLIDPTHRELFNKSAFHSS